MENFKKQLKQGDIIMHHAHGWLSNIIRSFDQSNYNHCSIYDSDGYIIESVNGGVQRKTIEDSIKTQKTYLITIFRLKNIPDNKTQLLIDNINKNYTSNTYAYSQILLLAFLLLKRKLKLRGFLGRLVNVFYSFFEKIIMFIFDRKDKNMMCSELIYRTYMDIYKQEKNSDFCFDVPLECSPVFELEEEVNQHLFPCDIDELNRIKLIGANNEMNFQKQLFEGTLPPYKRKTYSTINSNFNKNKMNNKLSEKLKKSKLYNYITPGDLVRSSNIYEVATYKTKRTKTQPNCKLCQA